MARNVQTTTVQLELSAAQAKTTLKSLKDHAKDVEAAIAAIDETKEPAKARQLQAELNRTNRLIRSMQTNARNAAQVLANLDRSTPNELKRTLSYLTRQLGGMRQGTQAYIRTSEDIRRVRQQLENVNSSLRNQESLWERIKNAGTGAVALIQYGWEKLTGLLDYAKDSVQQYAELEGEMANVRKYSGMTEEQVAQLNEEFKKLDTRTSREDLNKLAQDAGRLGKNSVEDVMGFVRAADKINVALDDLGDGATLTLSKLAGLFGIEEQYGTEQGLLKVGSVINDLSQNCSASAPYIAEFTSRMGAAGVQAGMTIQEIMAFGAVMDECNVNVEASSTALSQLIIKIFKDPAKYAKAAGLDVKEFYRTMTTDANEGFLMLIEALSKKGGLDKLAPVFAEMGANGSEAQKALGLLAQNIDKVRAQQEAANESFKQGTSIAEEFEVQNNTVAASLDKAKKSITETTVEIGQQLLPVVRSSVEVSSWALSVVKVLIGILWNNKDIILGTAAAWATYKLAVMAVNTQMTIMAACHKVGAIAIGTVRSAVLLSTAAYNRLTGNVGRAAAAMRTFKSITSSTTGIIGVLVSIVGIAAGFLTSYISKTIESIRLQQQHREELRKINSQLLETQRNGVVYAREELNKAKDLYNAATQETNAKNKRIEAAKRLISLYPELFQNFSAEQVILGKAKTAYDNLTEAILKNATAKAAAEKIAENTKKRIELEQTITDLREERQKVDQARQIKQKLNESKPEKVNSSLQTLTGALAAGAGANEQWKPASTREETNRIKSINRELTDTWDTLLALNRSNKTLLEKYGSVIESATPIVQNDFTIPDGNGGGSLPVDKKELARQQREAEKTRKAAERKAKADFKKGLEDIQAERERADAETIVAYRTGIIKYSEYKEEMESHEEKMITDKIAFYEKAGLGDDEDVAALTKKLEEARTKWKEQATRLKLRDLKADQSREENEAQIAYTTPGSGVFRDEEMLQQRLFGIRMKYLRLTAQLYAEGTEERADAVAKIEEADTEEQLRRQKLTAEKLVKFQEQYTTLPIQKRRDEELAILDELHSRGLIKEEEYQKARAKIIKKYKQEIKDFDDNDEKFSPSNEWASMVNNMYESIKAFFDTSADDLTDWAEKVATVAKATFAVFSVASQAASSLMAANVEYETAVISKAYDRQIQAASQNSARQQRLEKQKEKAISEARAKAAKRDFALQVATAIAQTAMNGVQAYYEGLKIGGLAGLVMAPIAAAMAVAAGAVQIATIKKQKDAAMVAGYASGGFTKKGEKYEPAGIVHAGEWVANRELLENPATRPLIDILEYARVNNTLPTISAADVSGSLTAPIVATRRQESATALQAREASAATDPTLATLAEAVDNLNAILSTPIRATVNMTGEGGLVDAQARYRKLIKNSRRL